MNHLSTLANVIPDDVSRFRAAFALAAAAGHSMDVLLGDMDKCLVVLQSQGHAFEDELKRQMDSRVGARRQAVESIDGQIKSKQEEIGRLQSEISQLSEQRGTDFVNVSL